MGITCSLHDRHKKKVQTGSGVHPASYLMGTGASFTGVRRREREANLSPPTSAEVTASYVFMA
jgi:hypothetical protein